MNVQKRIDVLGIGFDNLSMDEAVKAAIDCIHCHSGAWAVTPNPEIVMLARSNPALSEAIEKAALVVPDGIGIIYAAKILRTPLRSKLPGIDLACGIMRKLSEEAGRVYLLGAKPGIAEKAAETLLTNYPGLIICGMHNGYFNDDEPIIASIRDVRPDLLLVCLGAPKQELWMCSHAAELDVGLMIGLGGSLDVFAGAVQRAPQSWQKLGLEWLYRLLKEPKRIGRMMKLPLFLLTAFMKRIRGN